VLLLIKAALRIKAYGLKISKWFSGFKFILGTLLKCFSAFLIFFKNYFIADLSVISFIFLFLFFLSKVSTLLNLIEFFKRSANGLNISCEFSGFLLIY
jgi:hypothetical protein